jgi:hypothetical protein
MNKKYRAIDCFASTYIYRKFEYIQYIHLLYFARSYLSTVAYFFTIAVKKPNQKN